MAYSFPCLSCWLVCDVRVWEPHFLILHHQHEAPHCLTVVSGVTSVVQIAHLWLSLSVCLHIL